MPSPLTPGEKRPKRGTRSAATLASLFQFEAEARKLLPRAVYESVAGGALDELTLRRNRDAFGAIQLRPRVLVDVADRRVSTTVLGQSVDFPVLVGPAGLQGAIHPDGELATVRAAGAMGTIGVVSGSSSFTMEEIAEAATGPIWFELVSYRDPGLTKSFVERASEAGYSALCLSVGVPVPPKRERASRNSKAVRPSPNYAGLGQLKDLKSASATWADLDRLAANSPLPLTVKGIMTAEDARLCFEHGVKGLIVSNYGGRQLDSVLSTVEVLPEVVDAVEGKLEVYLDGGIRRGTDVLKALALGARAVTIARPYLWGLAVHGEAGVRAVLHILRDELDTAMAQSGRPTLESIDRRLLASAPLPIPTMADDR